MLRNNGESISNKSLRTLLVEVEGIINSRPITCESIGDVNSIILLSPMQLLSSKTTIVMPPLGTFQKEDMYCRKKWWRVQHFSNEFWTRWRKEVFATFQTNQKWNQPSQISKQGILFWYVTMLLLQTMARILKTYSDEKGLVRSVQLVNGRTNSTNKEASIFNQSVNKLVLLGENEL